MAAVWARWWLLAAVLACAAAQNTLESCTLVDPSHMVVKCDVSGYFTFGDMGSGSVVGLLFVVGGVVP